MFVYRIARTEHIRYLTGTGAKLYGGRWNQKGAALIYTSETRSLATVEFLVHVSLPNVPDDLSIATIDIPDDVVLEEVAASSLPRNWHEYPAPLELADLGTAWIRANRSLLLRVPSAVVEHEYNILINPSHQDISRIVLVEVESYMFDKRLMQ